jgi:hypothetical protein
MINYLLIFKKKKEFLKKTQNKNTVYAFSIDFCREKISAEIKKFSIF